MFENLKFEPENIISVIHFIEHKSFVCIEEMACIIMEFKFSIFIFEILYLQKHIFFFGKTPYTNDKIHIPNQIIILILIVTFTSNDNDDQ